MYRYRIIPHQINTEKRHFQPDPLRIEWFFCEILVPMEINITAKFYCFMATRADIQSCQKTRFLATSCLRKSGITSALIEIQSSFYAHFKANKMPFPVSYYTSILSTVMFSRSSNLTFDLVFLKMLQGVRLWPVLIWHGLTRNKCTFQYSVTCQFLWKTMVFWVVMMGTNILEDCITSTFQVKWFRIGMRDVYIGRPMEVVRNVSHPNFGNHLQDHMGPQQTSSLLWEP
jgi:hypothetical protein